MITTPGRQASWPGSNSTVKMTTCVFHYSWEQEEKLRTAGSQSGTTLEPVGEVDTGERLLVYVWCWMRFRCQDVDSTKESAAGASLLLQRFYLHIITEIKSSHSHAPARTALHLSLLFTHTSIYVSSFYPVCQQHTSRLGHVKPQCVCIVSFIQSHTQN